jgi:DNA-directed RNA polymerase subunit M/transcription elongation factor TFIIS
MMAEQCEVCGEGFVTQIEELVGLRYYNCDTCGSDYATSEQVSHNLSLNKEMPSDA